MSIRLSGIFVYPVKAVRAVPVPRAMVLPAGLAHDRRWVLVDPEGQFISQRTRPQLARVQATLAPDGLRLAAPGCPDLTVPEPGKGSRLAVRIWRDSVSAAAAGPDADRWFSAVLGEPCHLVWMDPDCRRPAAPGAADTPSGELPLSFADGYPVLLASEASLADLNGRLPAPIPMSRFRPNLVFSGGAAFAEDGWQRLTIGQATFVNAGPCARCQVTTIDQQSGAATGPEPLRTLALFRQIDKGVAFGANLVVERPGWVAVGDTIELFS